MIDFPSRHRPGLKLRRDGPRDLRDDHRRDGRGQEARSRQAAVLAHAGVRRVPGWEAAASNTAHIATEIRLQDTVPSAITVYAARNPVSTFAAAALATLIAVSLLASVAHLFQRDGKPLARLAAAERACAHYPYQSERQVCMNQRLAAAQSSTAAGR